MGFANEKGWNKQIFLGYFSNGEGVDFVDTLSRNQDFDLLRQRNKQTSSISLKALKLAVFLVGNEFRLRILFGKRICFPSPSAVSKLLCLQSEAYFFTRYAYFLSKSCRTARRIKMPPDRSDQRLSFGAGERMSLAPHFSPNARKNV